LNTGSQLVIRFPRKVGITGSILSSK